MSHNLERNFCMFWRDKQWKSSNNKKNRKRKRKRKLLFNNNKRYKRK